MLNLRTHIEEALFSKKELDPKKASLPIEKEILKFFTLHTLRMTGVKSNKILNDNFQFGNGGIEFHGKTRDDWFSLHLYHIGTLKGETPPCKISKVTNCRRLKLVGPKLNTINLQDIFTDNCEFDLNTILVLPIQNLKSLKGIPDVDILEFSDWAEAKPETIDIKDFPKRCHTVYFHTDYRVMRLSAKEIHRKEQLWMDYIKKYAGNMPVIFDD